MRTSHELTGDHFCVLLLALIGLAAIFVAANHDKTPVNVSRTVLMQFAWYVIGTIMIIVIMQFDSSNVEGGPNCLLDRLIFNVRNSGLYSRAYYVNTGAKSWLRLGRSPSNRRKS